MVKRDRTLLLRIKGYGSFVIKLSEGNMLAICHANRGSAIPPAERYLNEVDHTDYYRYGSGIVI